MLGLTGDGETASKGNRSLNADHIGEQISGCFWVLSLVISVANHPRLYIVDSAMCELQRSQQQWGTDLLG